MRAPLALQVLGLLIAGLVIAQAAALTVVLVLPPDRTFYHVDEIAQALKGGPLAARSGRSLVRKVEAAPPLRTGPGWNYISGARLELARLLGVSAQDVRLQIYFPPPLVGLGARGGGPGDGRYRSRRSGFAAGAGPPGLPSGVNGETLDAAGRPGAPPGAAPPPDGRGFDPALGLPPPGPDTESGGAPRGFGFHRRGDFPIHASFVAALKGADGRWTVVTPPPEPFPNAWQRRVIVWFLASLAIIGPIGYLFARRLVAPLKAFAEAADRLGRDPTTPQLDLKGPAEIGLAAQAFNRMQARLQRYVEDRTAMVGAISHDLRTPLSRIRFKLEAASPELQRSVLSDVAQMEQMISSVLAFIRDAAEPACRERLDLRSLVECEVDEAALVGGEVALEPGEAVIVHADASGVQRVVSNLIDNALKYGERARVRIFSDDAEAVVEIADEGPGLADGEMDRVFLPFYRAEAARTLDKGGIGLGLAVSRSIARAHGGDVRLRSGAKGLVAQVRLPLAHELRQAAEAA